MGALPLLRLPGSQRAAALPQPPVPGSKQAERCPLPSPLLPARPFTALSRPFSHPGALLLPRARRPRLASPGRSTSPVWLSEARARAPRRRRAALSSRTPADQSSSNCSRPPSPPPAAKDTAAPLGSRRRAPLPPHGSCRSSHPELPPRPPGEVSANCPAGRSPDPPSTDRAEPLVPASHSSTTQPRRRPPIFPLAGQGGHAAGRRERAGTAPPGAGGEAASCGCAALSSAQLRSSPAAGWGPPRGAGPGGDSAGGGRASAGLGLREAPLGCRELPAALLRNSPRPHLRC